MLLHFRTDGTVSRITKDNAEGEEENKRVVFTVK